MGSQGPALQCRPKQRGAGGDRWGSRVNQWEVSVQAAGPWPGSWQQGSGLTHIPPKLVQLLYSC